MNADGIVLQGITFLLLVISEALPFSKGPANGVLHWLLRFLKATQTTITEPTTVEVAPAPRELRWGFLNKK